MTAEKLLIKLLEDIQNLSEKEYEKLISLTEINSISFLHLSERQVRFWLEWETGTEFLKKFIITSCPKRAGIKGKGDNPLTPFDKGDYLPLNPSLQRRGNCYKGLGSQSLPWRGSRSLKNNL